MVESLIDMGWWLAVVALVMVLGVGRWARLITYDTFPPAAWWRQKWSNWTKNHEEWGNLMFCPWCITPWLTLAAMGWFVLGFVHDAFFISWWIFWGWGALSYVAAMIVARDEPKG